MPEAPQTRDYDALYRQFRWNIPARYNIGVDVCDRWAARDPRRLAILHMRADGSTDKITYGWLRETSNRLANVLFAHGVARGDRVAIFMPQAPEVAVAHIAIYKLGAVVLPIAILFGPDALTYRLQNSGAKALLTNAQGLTKFEEIRAEVPDVTCVLSDSTKTPRRPSSVTARVTSRAPVSPLKASTVASPNSRPGWRLTRSATASLMRATVSGGTLPSASCRNCSGVLMTRAATPQPSSDAISASGSTSTRFTPSQKLRSGGGRPTCVVSAKEGPTK